MLLIGKFSNKPTANHITQPLDNPRAKIWKGQPDARAVPAVGGPLFAKWMSSPVEGIPNRVIWGTEAVAEEAFKGLHYLPAIFALIGIWTLRRRIAAEPGLAVLLVLAVLYSELLVYLGSRIGYVSERHTVLLTMIGCLFAGAALEPIAAALGRLPKVGFFWAGKFGTAALLLMLVGISLPGALKPMHANREGHKHAGQWLAAHLQKDDCLIDPFCWAEWYAGRSLYFVPADPPANPPPEVTYAVVDDKSHGEEHERLPRLDAAKNVVADGRSKLVYQWPENVPEEHAKVKVYKLIRK
jgi:hypothetical protein